MLANAADRLRQHPSVVAVGNRRIAATMAFADVGAGEQVVAALRSLIHEEPLHEAVHGRLMLALAATGQPAAALRVYAELRTRLADELGVEPGPDLQALHLRILRGQSPVSDQTTSAGDDRSPPMPSRSPPPPIPHQLPPRIAGFAGRRHETKQVSELVAQDRGWPDHRRDYGPAGSGQDAAGRPMGTRVRGELS